MKLEWVISLRRSGGLLLISIDAMQSSIPRSLAIKYGGSRSKNKKRGGCDTSGIEYIQVKKRKRYGPGNERAKGHWPTSALADKKGGGKIADIGQCENRKKELRKGPTIYATILRKWRPSKYFGDPRRAAKLFRTGSKCRS